MGEFLKMKSYLIKIKCHNCGILNRVKEHAKNLRPICGRCKEPIKTGAGYIIKLQWYKLLNIFTGLWNRFREHFSTIGYYLKLCFWAILCLYIIGIIMVRCFVFMFEIGIFFSLSLIVLLLLVIFQIIARSLGKDIEAIDIILFVISLALGIPTIICFLKKIS